MAEELGGLSVSQAIQVANNYIKPTFGAPKPDTNPGGDTYAPTTGASIPIGGTDWADAFWGSLGLPQSLINQINDALAKVTDPTQAMAVGQNLLRSSDWYKQTFPGIANGIQQGLFTDETGYRSYVNQLNNLYQQYYNRAISSDEVTGYLQSGRSATYVGNVLQGNALAQTQAPQLQYEQGAFGEGRLTDQQLQAYGQEQAGIDTPLGQQIQLRIQQAQKRLQTIAQGTLAAPNLSLGAQGVFAPTLAAGKQQTSARTGSPDVGAV